MLRVDRQTGACLDDHFRNLPHLLRAGDLLILNDSRVLPARLFATRARGPHTQPSSPDPAGRIEVLLTQQLAASPHNDWSALVRPAKKVQPGEVLNFHPHEFWVPHSSQPHRDQWDVPPSPPVLTAEVLTAGDFGERTLRFQPTPNFFDDLARIGHMPLPPYLHRPDEAADQSRYQTVYAETPGSAAAPTAGLHFTPEILTELRARGIHIETITLHVGLGTFQPVRAERLEDIRLHTEHYTLPAATASAVNLALGEGRRIIAAGTTTTRTLEHCAQTNNLDPHSGSTSIFLAPGHQFRIVSGLLTNFHLPQSTLLMLVSAFLGEDGRERALAAYAHAIHQRYRFYSYGDCMLIL